MTRIARVNCSFQGQLEYDRELTAGGGRLHASRSFGLPLDYERGLRRHPILPVLGCPEVSWRRAGGVVMGAPQILSTSPCSDTGR